VIVQVKLFAVVRELVGRDELTVEFSDSATLSDLKAKLLELHPDLESVLNHAMFAIDSEYADPDQPLREGAEVAIIPPVSGG